jgi:CBS domain containing-hemolysin-like protein
MDTGELMGTNVFSDSILGRPPAVGDAVVYHNVRFEVVEIEGNGAREAIAESLADQSPDQITSSKASDQNQ